MTDINGDYNQNPLNYTTQSVKRMKKLPELQNPTILIMEQAIGVHLTTNNGVDSRVSFLCVWNRCSSPGLTL